MDKDQYIVIAGKVADGIASESELALYNAYYNQYQAKYPAWNQLTDAERKLMLEEAELLIHTQLHHNAPVKKFKLWPRIAIAAAVAAIVVSAGIYFYNNSNRELAGRHPELVSGSQDIAPGGNKATLTVNGKQTQLSDNKTGVVINANDITYNDGSAITEAIAETLTLTTPRGGTYYAVLSDGTKIWLNADSKLELLPNFWNKAQRLVKLTGEAYFEVAKNKRQPFIVQTSRQVVEVLGTHFNINAYSDESLVKTTLIEGSVAVTSTTARPKRPDERAVVYPGVVLKPNQQSLINENNTITVKQVDASAAIAWKEGYFKFDNEPLASIMLKISRWYNVEVVYQDQQLKSTAFGGTVSRFGNVSQILNKLQLTGKAHFKIEGQKIIVTK